MIRERSLIASTKFEMLKPVYRLMQLRDPGYSYVFENFKGDYIFQIHELEKGEFFIVLITLRSKSNQLALASLKALPFVFSKRSSYSKVPIWTDYAEKILFFKRNGELIQNKELIKDLYSQAWIHEFLYSKPFIKVYSIQVDFIQAFYQENKKRLENFSYPKTEDPLDKKTYEISALLDKSDLELGGEFCLFLQNAKECSDISHDLSHNPNQEKVNRLKKKLSLINSEIQRLKEIIEKREKIWPEWNLFLKEYLRKRNKRKKLFFDFLIDLIPIPLLGSLTSLILIGLEEIKDSVSGHKSLQKSLKNYENLIKFAEQYQKDLFEISLPLEKLSI